MKTIAYIRSDFPSKFAIPRQSGICRILSAKVVFEPEYRNIDAFRGLEEYSHIWIIWKFSEAVRDEWSPTVRPPKLGGNTRMGVFATRSPFRPNPIGISSVRLESIDLNTPNGPVLNILGADIMDNTPIFDIKPYLAYTDSHPDALSGFANLPQNNILKVRFDEKLKKLMPHEKAQALVSVLEQDPRPGYRSEDGRVFGFSFAGFEISFSVTGDILSVHTVTKI